MRFMLIVLAFPILAHADPVKTPDARQMHTDDCEKARKANRPCVIDMGEGEKIGGNGLTPHGIGVTAIETPKHSSLVPIRREFIVEILKTAEDL